MSCPVVIGGIISELNGGSFSQGAIISAGAAAASIGLNSLGNNSQGNGTTGVGEDADTNGKSNLTVKKECLAKIFNIEKSAIDKVDVIEDSIWATGVRASTRENTIYLNRSFSAEQFWNSPDAVLEEYYHVFKQWNTGKLTVWKYIWEYITVGYNSNNRYEVPAWNFVDKNLKTYINCYAQ